MRWVCVALLAALLPLASCFTTSTLPFRFRCPRSSRGRWSLPKCEGRRTNGGLRAVKGALSDWAKNAGIETGPLDVATFEGGLRGMKARREIKEGEDLLAVPESAVIRIIGDTPSFPRNMDQLVSKEVWKQLPWYAQLSLMIIKEQRLKKEVGADAKGSKFDEWLDVLPSSLPTPLHWADDELMACAYRPIVTKVRTQRAAWREIYGRIKASGKSPPTEKEFFHNCELARSRAFSGDYTAPLPKEQFFLSGLLIAFSIQLGLVPETTAFGGGALVVGGLFFQSLVLPRILGLKHYVISPVIDMINHDTSEASEVTYAPFQKSFLVVSSRSYSRDKQVFISYGKRSNDQLLQYYGFVERNNPHDVFQILDLAQAVKEAMPGVTADQMILAREEAGGGGGGTATSDGQDDAPACYLTLDGFDPVSMSVITFLNGGDSAKASATVKKIAESERARIKEGVESGKEGRFGKTAGEKANQQLMDEFVKEKLRILDAVIAR